MFNDADFYCELPKLGASLAVKSPQSSGFQNKQLSFEISVAKMWAGRRRNVLPPAKALTQHRTKLLYGTWKHFFQKLSQSTVSCMLHNLL